MQEAPLVEKKEKIMPSSESYTYITNLQGKMCLHDKKKTKQLFWRKPSAALWPDLGSTPQENIHT